MEVRSGGLLSGGGGGGGGAGGGQLTQSDIVVSRGRSRWRTAHVKSEQALLKTTEVIWQQCSVSFEWQPTNDLRSPPVDLWGRGCDVE